MLEIRKRLIYLMKHSGSYKAQLRHFIISCNGMPFSTREEVVCMLICKIDSPLVEDRDKNLLHRLTENIDEYNDVFSEFGIYPIPSVCG